MGQPINGTITFSICLEVREFDPANEPELRDLVEEILARRLGDETFSSFLFPDKNDSNGSRGSVRSLVKLRRLVWRF